jgi:hypothetical protein
MAKNLLGSVMAASFRRSEVTVGNVTKQPVLTHEAITVHHVLGLGLRGAAPFADPGGRGRW